MASPVRLVKWVFWRILRPAYEVGFWHYARLHRSKVRDTVFIGVTGSAGKTTTKDLTAAVLATRLRGHVGRGSGNYAHDVAANVLSVRPDDQFRVVEVGANDGPGSLDKPLALLRPRIGVVISVSTDHYTAFGSIEAIAAEKGKLVRALPPDGVAILNADDPRVLAMREGHAGPIRTFGLSAGADLRAEEVSGAWPDRLSFTLVHAGERVPVRTQLCGTHWVSAALAAVAVGLELGIPLSDAAKAIGEVEPFKGRMNPVELADGVTFIRDDLKASLGTIPPVLEFLRSARAARKILVLGTISDHPGNNGIYTRVARQALEEVDLLCAVGPGAFFTLRAQKGATGDRVRAFGSVKAATAFLMEFLRPGDLVVLKGSNTSDHLVRILLARSTKVACWQSNCGRMAFCDTCALVAVPSEPASGELVPVVADAPPARGGHVRAGASDLQVIVGLGNPDPALANTPHSVGHAAVDALAEKLGARWSPEEGAHIAAGDWDGEPVRLVKLTAWMNHSGPALRTLGQRLGFDAAHCILIYDDLDLPLGSLRARANGSDGGHLGVRSILEAFQTDKFRRVKLGVKRAGPARSDKERVLAPFSEEDRAIIEGVYPQAFERVLSQIREARRAEVAVTRAPGATPTASS